MDIESLTIDRKPRRKRRKSGSWTWRLVVLAVVAGAVFLFWRPLNNIVDQFRLPLVALVQVEQSHPATVSSVSGAAANGHIVASRRAALSADTPGRIVELNVTEGTVLKKGDVVARLYSDEYAAALQREKANLVAAQAGVTRAQAAVSSSKTEVTQRERNREAVRAQVTEAEANRELAQATYDRAIKLLQQGSSSQAKVDDALANLKTAKARVTVTEAGVRAATAAVEDSKHQGQVAVGDLKVAEARVVVARAEVNQAAATLDKTIVRAPFDGIVVLKDAEVGEVVSPNSQGGSNARGSVCTMVDFASLEVQAEVPETSLAKVKLGAPANVYLDAWPDRLYRGTVARIWPTANRQQGTVEVRIAFEKPDLDLRPDMGVRVVFLDKPAAETDATQQPKKSQILVPATAIVEVAGKEGAFVLERESVRFQEVQVGQRRAGRVQILSGLRPGQRIVKEPPTSLRDGNRVRIQKG